MAKAKILVVEDESIVALDIKYRLENLGYSVPDLISTGEAAIATVAASRPDLILMDIKLKGEMDGIEAANIIRSQFEVPIIFLTAFADSKTLQRAKITEPFGYILKPFEERELSTSIEMALYKHKAEKAIKEREEYFRALIENSSDVITIMEKDGRICYNSSSIERVLGYRPDELIGKNVFDLIHPEDVDHTKREFDGAIQNHKVIPPLRFRFRHKDGTWRTIEAIGRDRVEDPVVAGIVVNSRDITERVQAEDALRQSITELARSNAFIAALGQVAAKIETTSNPNQVLETLGSELNHLGLTCMVLLQKPETQGLLFNYTSIKPSILELVEKYTGISFNRHRSLSGQGIGQMRLGQPGYFPDLVDYMHKILPQTPRLTLERSVRMAGITPFIPTIGLQLKAEDRVVGDLAVWGASLREEDIPALTVFANQVAISIEKAWLFEAVQRRAKETETLRQAAAAVTSALDLHQVLDRILENLAHVVPYDSAAIFLEEENQLRITAGKGFAQQDKVVGQTFPLDNPLFKEAHRNSSPLVLRDAQADPRFEGWGQANNVRGWMGIPLVARGEVIGYLTTDSHRIGAYDKSTAALAQAFANEVAIAIENARLFEQTQRLAITDPLTNLYNRRHFFQIARREFERSHRYEKKLSLLMIDIDHFKQVNDNHGHAVGDQVLRVVAERCKETLREVDVVGRYGGEEFVVLIPETPAIGADQVAERLRKSIAETPIEAGGKSVVISASFGIAELDPECPDLDALLNRADQALYRSKQAGKNRVEIWEP